MTEKKSDDIMVVDGNGRPLKIPRKDWVEKVLPKNLQRARDNPDELHLMLISALRERLGSTPAVAEAVKRLAEIDSNLERVTVVNGVFLMQTGGAAEAEKLFDDYLAKHGDSAVILTNRSKLYHDRGEKELAEQTLRRALAIDPNLDNGMGWYCTLQRQRGGEEGFLAALRELANHPNSWRPQLWLARDLLKKNRVEEAMEFYRQVVSHDLLPPDGFVQLTGDLGSAGETERMAELLLPVYDPDRQGPVAGLNLINALAQLGRIDEAKSLLTKLQTRKNPAVAPLIADTARRLAAASSPKGKPAPTPPAAAAADGRVQVAAVPLFNPVWTPPLNKPQWLTPRKTEGVKIAFFSLADATRPADAPAPENEPASSRLTRSLPMYLAESLRLRSDAITVCIVPVLPGVGPAVTATPWPLPQMLEACPSEFSPDVVVCGIVGRGARGARVELHLFGVQDRQPLKTFRFLAADDFTGVALKAEQDLIAFLANSNVKPIATDLKPPERIDAYLACLDDLLSQMLAASNVIKPGVMRDDRQTYDNYFALAKPEHTSPLPAIAAAAGVLAAMKCESATAGSYRQPLLDLIQDASGRFPAIRKLSPVIYLRLNQMDLYEAAKAAVAEESDPVYQQWLQSLVS